MYLFILVETCLPTHCRCRDLLLYLITQNYTRSVGLHWTRDLRSVAEDSGDHTFWEALHAIMKQDFPYSAL
jgi:hypothetical protein